MTLEVIFPPEKEKLSYLEPDRFDRIVALHNWFDQQPEVGKTMSLASFERYGRKIALTRFPRMNKDVPARNLWAMA